MVDTIERLQSDINYSKHDSRQFGVKSTKVMTMQTTSTDLVGHVCVHVLSTTKDNTLSSETLSPFDVL